VKSFYRYLRPVRFDTSRLEFNTLPNGGVCLRFDENEWAGLTFSAARCHEDDHFNKGVARKIADSRMAVIKNDPRLLEAASIPYVTEDTNDLAALVIDRCEQWQPSPETHTLVSHYLSIEWKGLAQQLFKLLLQNSQEREKGAAFITAAHALELAAAYQERMRGA